MAGSCGFGGARPGSAPDGDFVRVLRGTGLGQRARTGEQLAAKRPVESRTAGRVLLVALIFGMPGAPTMSEAPAPIMAPVYSTT
jgi:hypothetical protein